MNPATAKLLVLSSVTFLLGLGTGAAVFSKPPAPPPAAVTEAPPASAEPLTALPVGPVLPAPPPASAEPAPPDPALAAEVARLTEGWDRLQAELAGLRARVAALERRPVAMGTPAGASVAAAPPPSADTPERERDALVRAGLPPSRADELLQRRAEVALAQLELRDQAIREGWLGSERYREELRALNEREVSLRDELDPFTYDRYLYESGEPNRVRVDAVIPGSVAAENGLLPGDLIESYADQRIFDYRELRDATAEGVRGEPVPVQIRRGSEILELWLPRGPIGIRLDSARVAP